MIPLNIGKANLKSLKKKLSNKGNTSMQFKVDNDVPILFTIFNRPKETSRVFEEIRRVAPKKLFIAADGPRMGHASDFINCELTRKACSPIDWDCEVFTKFSEINLGCKISISQAISWFFENVEAGIILEDDCLPSPSFFSFSREMLVKYQNEPRVMQISGNNYLGDKYLFKEDYYFTALNDIWGWATWRRAWNEFDINMVGYENFKLKNGVRKYLQDKSMSNWLTLYLDDAMNPDASVWSSQWVYAIAKNNALTIAPAKNLVENIGFDDQGTHSSSPSWRAYNRFKRDFLEIKNHPKLVERNFSADSVRFLLIKKTDPRCFLSSRIKLFIYEAYKTIKQFMCRIKYNLSDGHK
jgi:hypothetical protein